MRPLVSTRYSASRRRRSLVDSTMASWDCAARAPDVIGRPDVKLKTPPDVLRDLLGNYQRKKCRRARPSAGRPADPHSRSAVIIPLSGGFAPKSRLGAPLGPGPQVTETSDAPLFPIGCLCFLAWHANAPVDARRAGDRPGRNRE